MQALILSCNTGEGHNSCAKAIKEVFDAKGDVCNIKDALGFISEKTSRFMSWGHVFVYRNLPWLFNQGYEFSEKHTSTFTENNALYNFFCKGSEELSNVITNGAYDTVISTHPFASIMLAEAVKRYDLSVKTAFVATDYTCSPSVKDSALDYYFIPDELLKDEFECKNIPKEKMFAVGIPIRQMFYKHTDMEAAKRSVGVDPDKKHIVMMCGSMGCGPIKELTQLLAEQLQDNTDLTIICGTNDKLKDQLEGKHNGTSNLHILGFVKDMSVMLDSADLYLTKAGGLSTTEAATKKLPMIFINAVAGCEDYNSDFFTKLGCARRSSDITELAQICTSLIADETAYSEMVSAFDKCNTKNTSECIYSILKNS